MLASQKPIPTVVFPVWWRQGPRNWPDFKNPESFFIFGMVDYGKSNTAMALAENFLFEGGTIFDIHGADNDFETGVWLLSPYKDRTAVVVGEDVDVEMPFEKIRIGEFTMKKAEEYDVILTDKMFFVRKKAHYSALGQIFTLCKNRRGWREGNKKKIVALLVREARKVIRSQLIAGTSRNEQEAQEELIDMNNQRAHSGISPILDTQRYMDVSTSFRQLANYRIIKGFGVSPSRTSSSSCSSLTCSTSPLEAPQHAQGQLHSRDIIGTGSAKGSAPGSPGPSTKAKT